MLEIRNVSIDTKGSNLIPLVEEKPWSVLVT
jgi:hypothetical protein